MTERPKRFRPLRKPLDADQMAVRSHIDYERSIRDQHAQEDREDALQPEAVIQPADLGPTLPALKKTE